MRKVRVAVALACASGAILVGTAAPVQAAGGASSQPSGQAVASVPSPYHFGTYYTLAACQYFGDSLVAAGIWNWYRCVWQADPYSGVYYWYLYMYT